MCPGQFLGRFERQAEKQAADRADERERTEAIDATEFRMEGLVLHLVWKLDRDLEGDEDEREH